MTDSVKTIRWDGIVEDRNDPLKTGAVRVRIFNPRIHPWLPNGEPDKVLIPTDKLPLAQVKIPPNQSRTTSIPMLGEWVSGYFLDGENMQMPIIDGSYGGITLQKIFESDGPVSPYAWREPGEPTTSRTARGVLKGTQVEATNKSRDHVCNIYPILEQIVAEIKIKFQQALEFVRAAIRKLLKALGFDPSGEVSWLYNFLKWLAREIRKILKVLEQINALIERIRKALVLLAQMIAYILSLAKELLAFLRACLSEFIGSISSAVSLLIDGLSDTLKQQFSSLKDDLSSGTDSGALTELINAAKDVRNAVKEVATATGATIVNAGGALGDFAKTATSSNSADIAAGEESLKSLLGQGRTSGQASLDQTKFDYNSVARTP